jgi:predicted metal-binding membrane protein
VFNAFGQDSERKHLCLRQCLFPIRTIGQNARQLRHFREPSTVIFALGLNAQLHVGSLI